ncbi:DUF4404 family protein [Planctomicrobium piriforme]|uniref:DUF4404 family protein n=1 Tax=Planctomicrobium piriforme TaxID=1576369 RepID=A0A1I3T5S8_9PLAN|nr:DUF4404 family protein [Planctomicrobium piriforme]SFJ66404.1 protein of unknown function [Planctomicrobium piriforme]
MEREQVKATLQQLHQQIRSGGPVDPETQALLQQLADDVNLLLQKSANPGAVKTVEPEQQSVLDRLLSFTDEFADTHPQLAEAIGRVATALSRIGI